MDLQGILHPYGTCRKREASLLPEARRAGPAAGALEGHGVVFDAEEKALCTWPAGVSPSLEPLRGQSLGQGSWKLGYVLAFNRDSKEGKQGLHLE